MAIGPLLYQRLSAAVPALGGRIYPVEMAQEGALPAAVYSVSGAVGVAGSAPVRTQTIQIDLLADNHAAVDQLAGAVIAALDGWAQAGPALVVMHCTYANRTDFAIEADAYRISVTIEAVTRPIGG